MRRWRRPDPLSVTGAESSQVRHFEAAKGEGRFESTSLYRCDRMTVTTVAYDNPVYEKSFADPFVWRVGDDDYAVGTGPEEADGAALSHVFSCAHLDRPR